MAPHSDDIPAYERDEADGDAPNFPTRGSPEVPWSSERVLPFAFSDDWMIPVEPGQAVSTGWLPTWSDRPCGVTWHWGATPSLLVLSRCLGGVEAWAKGSASAHYGVGRTYGEGVHRYVAVANRSWHAGKRQVVRWDGRLRTSADEKGSRTTIGVETDHVGHRQGHAGAPADWLRTWDGVAKEIAVQPWTGEQLTMMIEVGLEIQRTWPHLGWRDHHGHSDLCPDYKTDVIGFPFARVLRGIYPDADIPDVWTPFLDIQGRQRALLALGYDLGSYGVDGDWGALSRAALQAFKRDRGLPERELAGDPVGGRWSTFVGQAVFDAFADHGLVFEDLLG